MPEWLRLLTGAAKKGTGAAKKAITEVVPREITSTGGYFAPAQRMVPQMPAPLLSLPSATPSFLALPSAQKAYVTPFAVPASDEVIRVATRRSMGLPDYQTVPNYMSLEELQHLLETQYRRPANYSALQTMNAGIEPGYSGHIDDFPRLLTEAANAYGFRRARIPYTTFGDFERENDMLDQFGSYIPDEAIEPLVREYTQLGLGVPQKRRFKYMQEDAARELVNSGEITGDNPIVKGIMDDYGNRISGLPERFFNVFEDLTGSIPARESSEHVARQLWPLVTREIVPGSELDLQTQRKYGRKYQYIIDSSKYRDVLQKIRSVDSLPEREKRWFKGLIGASYQAPIPGSIPTEPWLRLKLDKVVDVAKDRFGVDTTPEELLQLYAIENPDYNKVMRMLEDAQYALRKKDFKIDDLRTLYDTTDPRYADLEKILSDAKAKFGENFTVKDLPWVYERYNSQYPAIAKKIRPQIEILPGDLQHFSWFQVRNAKESSYPGIDWTLPGTIHIPGGKEGRAFEEQTKENWKALKEREAQTMVGLQEQALSHALPAETALAEQHTSANSYRLGVKEAARKDYGQNPGQTEVIQIPTRGDDLRSAGNDFHLNRVNYRRLDPNNPSSPIVLRSDLGLPEIDNLQILKDHLDKLTNDLYGLEPDQIVDYLRTNPEAVSLIDKVGTVIKTLHQRDLQDVRPAFESINKKHRKLGMKELTIPQENEFPLFSDAGEAFYDPENIRKVVTLLRRMHHNADSGRGFAVRLERRTPYIVLQHRYGGQLLPWTQRILNKKASQ